MKYSELVKMIKAKNKQKSQQEKQAEKRAPGRPRVYPEGYKPDRRNYRKEYYERCKAEKRGDAVRYKEKMNEDPLFNRKVYLEKVTKDSEYNIKRAAHNNVAKWEQLIEYILASGKTSKELAEELSAKYRVCYTSVYEANHKRAVERKEGTYIYRPRVRNTLLNSEQLEALEIFAEQKGLAVEREILRTEVLYNGDMLGIDDRREEKKVDIYTAQDAKETGKCDNISLAGYAGGRISLKKAR